MRKISEIHNEDALDLLADILEPSSKIFSDKKVQKMFTAKNTNRMETARYLLKGFKHEIIEILAALDGVPVAEYDKSAIAMIASVLEVLNDKDLISFFQSQGQMADATIFGSATVNSEVTERK